MSDDLDSFFKKKSSGGKKKKHVQKIDELGKRLEKTAKRQEELDREEDERKQLQKEQEIYIQQNANDEDSEWHNFGESKAVDLASVGIKDMEIMGTEQNEQEENTEEAEPEHVRGWNLNPEPVAKVEVQEEPQQTQPKLYVPAHLRRLVEQKEKAPDVSSAMDFPSLGEAENLEKEKREKEKRDEARRQQFNERQSALNAERAAVCEAAAAVTHDSPNPNAYVPPSRRPLAEQRTYSPSPEPELRHQPTGSAYVPPHLRQATLKTSNRFSGLQDNN